MEESRIGPGIGDPAAETRAEMRDREPAANTPASSSDSDQASPEIPTPEQDARPEPEGHTRGLLKAYQETLNSVEDLPAVVWVPWNNKGLGYYLKIPYLRLFLRYFVAHHIGRTLDILNRQFHAKAALSSDPESNRSDRDAVKLYLQSLPSPPYRILIFAAVLVALVIALPMQAFGNVFYVIDLVGAVLRFDLGYVGRAFEGKDLGPTVRSFIVLLIGLIVVATVLTSPFGLKRILFNLYPQGEERLDSTAARSHGLRVEGLYLLEDSIFDEVGIRRPREGKWDLVFQTFLLLPLLFFGLCLAFVTLALLMSWNINIDANVEGSQGNINFTLPMVPWYYYALCTGLVFAAFGLLFKRVITAWRKRSRKPSSSQRLV